MEALIENDELNESLEKDLLSNKYEETLKSNE